MVTCQFEKIIKGQNQLPWVFLRWFSASSRSWRRPS